MQVLKAASRNKIPPVALYIYVVYILSNSYILLLWLHLLLRSVSFDLS